MQLCSMQKTEAVEALPVCTCSTKVELAEKSKIQMNLMRSAVKAPGAREPRLRGEAV